jgi:hypothetical protein
VHPCLRDGALATGHHLPEAFSATLHPSAGAPRRRTRQTSKPRAARFDAPDRRPLRHIERPCLNPYCEQVFRLERHFVRIPDDKVFQEVSYDPSSLTRDEANAERLLELVVTGAMKTAFIFAAMIP